jgi:hypothetical protein
LIALPVRSLEDDLQDRCPWCEQPIPHERFEEIQAHFKAEEQKRLGEQEVRLRSEFEATREQDQVVSREAGRVAAEAAAAPVLAAAQAATAAVQQQLTEAKQSHAETVTAERDQKETAQRALAIQLEKEAQVIQAGVTAGVAEVRAALEVDFQDKLNIKDAVHFKEQQALQNKVADLQRQVQQQTNNALGEGAEVALFEALKTNFPQDELRRVQQGTEGADIIHTIREKGRVCGKIVYDSKNRRSWRHSHAEKLRRDQIAEKAEHAILSTSKFPADRSQLHCLNGVVLANPARVIELVRILRQATVQMALLRMSEEEREEKKAALYDLITSPRWREILARKSKIDDDLLALDEREVKAHQKVWQERGTLIKTSQQTQAGMEKEIALIVETPSVILLRAAT